MLRARSADSNGLHIPARIALVELEVLALCAELLTRRVGLVALRVRRLVRRRQAVTSSLLHTTHLQLTLTTYNLQLTTYNVQLTTYNVQLTT